MSDKAVPILTNHDIEMMSEREAIRIFHMMRDHFNWAGTFFTRQDVECSVDEWLGDDYTEEQRTKIVHWAVNSRMWNRYLAEALCLEGNECIDEAIREAVSLLEKEEGK